MTDRELLELAAKAAGLDDAKWQDMAGWGELRHGFSSAIFSDHLRNETGSGYWNPLTDDGDALRLAVKLGMNVFQAAKSAYALPSDDDGTYEEQVRYVDTDGDPYAATRRAVVRAAASLVVEGKGEAT